MSESKTKYSYIYTKEYLITDKDGVLLKWSTPVVLESQPKYEIHD